MRLYLNNLTDLSKKCCELDEAVVCASGHDKMKYIEPRKQIASDLGFDTWIEPKFKPVFSSENTGGSLDSSKHYSILVVPVDKKTVTFSDFQRGTPTLYSMPVKPSTTGKSLVFNIPSHEQVVTYECGKCTEAGTLRVTDDTKEWTVGQYEDYMVRNIETGVDSLITSNAPTYLNAPGSVFAEGDRYAIVKSKATDRDIYAVEVSSESAIAGGTFIFQGSITDNDPATTYELKSYVSTGETVLYSNIPPESYAYCTSVNNRLFAGGGIESSEGLAYPLITETVRFASGTDPEDAIAVSLFTAPYVSSPTGRIMKYEFGANITAVTDLYIGSRVDITSTANPAGDIENAMVIDVASDKSWFTIYNDNGVVDPQDNTMEITITPNVIIGDGTAITEGMINGSFAFNGESRYNIHWIDAVNQKFTLDSKYDGTVTSNTEITVSTDYNLSWSDFSNPHVWRSENQADISDRIMAIEPLNGYLLIFCSRSLWKLPLNNLIQSPVMVSNDIVFRAPMSVVITPLGIMFYDGGGISITNGQSVQSVTKFKATDLLQNINPEMDFNVKGAYDPSERRVEYVFPYGTDVTNNAGIYIGIDSLGVFPFTRMDCNAIWSDEDDDGRSVIMHGTSGRHVASGSGTVNIHDKDASTDGEFGAEQVSATVVFVNVITAGNRFMTVAHETPIVIEEGSVALHYPKSPTGLLIQFMVKSITDNGDGTSNIYFSDDWYYPGFESGATIVFGVIPIDYGIKWMDFSSPQYQHKVRQVHIDIVNFSGRLIIDHFSDLNEVSTHSDEFIVTPDDTKIIAQLRKKSSFTYGFRLRGYSTTKAEILSFEILFDAEI